MSEPHSPLLVASNHYDVVIVGGGMSGACMALALSTLPLSIAVLDAVPFASQSQPSFDDRSVALSYGSSKILQSIGVWESLQSIATSIQHIHVSDRGHFGFSRLHADQLKCSALGYVVENRAAGTVFYEALRQHKNITLLAPYTVTDVLVNDDSADLAVSKLDSHGKQSLESTSLSAKLIIAADGTFSKMAQLLKMAVEKEEYSQMAIIFNAATDRPKTGWAYERFTDTGPLALLPLSNQRYSVVWSIEKADKEKYLTMSDREFAAALQERFGFRAGNVKQVGKRQIYPLVSRKLKRGYGERVAFIGNALHTSHPVAGQGFNLGLRDIAWLTEKITLSLHKEEDIGGKALLEDYWLSRCNDIQETQQRIDGLARLFVNQNSVLSITRNIALKWLDIIGPAKKSFAYQAMGLRDDLPLLARGITVTDILSSDLKVY